MSAVSTGPARRAAVLLTIGLLGSLGVLGGCSGGGPATPRSSPYGSGSDGTAVFATASTTPPEAGPGTTAAQTPPPPTDEVAYDPMPRTVTGIVDRRPGCTILVVGQVRWVLTGDLAAALPVGSQMRVTGNMTNRPSTCTGENGPELQVTSAVPA